VKYRPALLHHISKKLKELRKIRNTYCHLRQKGIVCGETRVLLWVLSKEMKIEIGTHKVPQSQNILMTIQQAHDDKIECFDRIYLVSINHAHYHFINYIKR
jgi:hypothetical protein